jgi:hypothetical protein
MILVTLDAKIQQATRCRSARTNGLPASLEPKTNATASGEIRMRADSGGVRGVRARGVAELRRDLTVIALARVVRAA